MFSNIKQDFPASIIVFLVAVPLCLGIAVASGAPPLSGIIAGIIGGIIVGSLSNSPLGVSGPAAGLVAIVYESIKEFSTFIPESVEGAVVVYTQSDKIAYGFELFLVSIIIGGIIQLILGFLKGGVVGYYFPNSVILGMLGGIGVSIFMSQMPNIIGIESSTSLTDIIFKFVKDEETLEIIKIAPGAIRNFAPGAILISLLSVAILALWERPFMKESKFSSLIQGPLVVVILGIVLNEILLYIGSDFALKDSNLVSLPIADNLKDFKGFFAVPNFTHALTNSKVYVTGAIVALVASLETLLCLEATDKLDPDKRISDPNKELKAQGIGNILSGLIGGLPITQVIVRSSANIQSGGKTKLSAILHGFFVLASLVLFPSLLNKLPIASLAAILLMVGYKLAHPSKFKEMWRKGIRQFLPFIVTLLLIYYVDMLWGIGIGLTIAIFIILYNNFRTPYFWKPEDQKIGEPIILRLSENVTFLNKAAMLKTLKSIPTGAHVVIDATNNVRIDDDVKEIIEDFQEGCINRDISVIVKGFENIQPEDSDKIYQKAVNEEFFKG